MCVFVVVRDFESEVSSFCAKPFLCIVARDPAVQKAKVQYIYKYISKVLRKEGKEMKSEKCTVIKITKKKKKGAFVKRKVRSVAVT